MRVLFICVDNIGRSQSAEALFNARAKKSLAESCGCDFRHGREPKKLADIREAEPVVQMMKEEYGIDISQRFMKPFDEKAVKRSDKVILLCNPSECPDVKSAEHWNTPRLSPLSWEERKKVIKSLDERIEALLKSAGE